MKRSLLLVALLALFILRSEAQSDPDVIEFAMITDTHRYGPSADIRYADANIQAFIDYCNHTPNLSFAIHGGDLINSYNTNHEQALWCLNHGRRDFDDIQIPLYVTKGNHDCNGKQRTADGKPDNSQIVTDHEFYNLFSPLSQSNPLSSPEGIVVDEDNPEGNYYYRDFPQQHFRLIILNSYDGDSLEIQQYSGRQVKWLAEKALNFEDKPTDEEWSFLLVGHSFSVNMEVHPTSRLMHAYVNGQPFIDSDKGYTYGGKYNKMHRGIMVGLLGGHVHEDIYRSSRYYNMISHTRGFAMAGEIGNPDEELCFTHYKLNTRTHVLEEKRIGRGRSRVFAYGDTVAMLSPIGTFPEADGMGIFTHGGSRGKVYEVTNLKDSGIGSLRWAVEQKGCRTVIFNVSGTIKLKSPLEILNDSITIAGHSAPSKGITLTGAPVKVLASEVIMRYLHLRGYGISDGDFGQHNLVFDHLSVSCTQGSCISIRRAKEVSVQNCLLSHPLLSSSVSSGDEQPAALVAGGFMATYHNNVIANAANAVLFPNEEGENRWIHLVRNIIYNWRDHAIFGGACQGEASIEENYLIPGSATINNQMLDVADDGTGRYYLWGNEMVGREDCSRQNRLMINDHVGLPYDPDVFDVELRSKMDPVQRPTYGSFASTCVSIAAFHYKPFFDQPTKQQLLRNAYLLAGCSRKRDQYDTDVLSHIRSHEPFGSENGLIADTRRISGLSDLPERTHHPSYDDLDEWLNDRVKKDKSIVIFYDNEPLCNIEGYPKLAGSRDAISPDTAHVAMVSCGDYLDGGLIGYMSKGRYVVDIMKYANYDAVTLGNHEFNFKVDSLTNILSPIRDIVTCSNLLHTSDDTPLFSRYIIRQYGRYKIAFVGVTTPHSNKSRTSSFLDANDHQKYYLTDDKELFHNVQKTVNDARQDGADYVIILSHLGNGNIYSDISSEVLIENTKGIDVVLDSNRPKALTPSISHPNADGKPVILSWAGEQFKTIGKMVIAPDGVITHELLSIDDIHYNNTPTMLMLDSIQAIYENHIKEVIGHTDISINLTDPETGLTIRQQETNAGDIVADAMRTMGDADFAIINSGSIRGELSAGQDISRADILKILPFDNKTVVVTLTGRRLLQLLNTMAKRLPSVFSGHLIQQSGLRYKVYEGQEVKDIEVHDKRSDRFLPLNPDATYNVATIDFCLYEDTYRDAFSDSKILKVEDVYAETFINYIRIYLNGVISNEYAHPQKRFEIIKQ